MMVVCFSMEAQLWGTGVEKAELDFTYCRVVVCCCFFQVSSVKQDKAKRVTGGLQERERPRDVRRVRQ